MNYELVIPHLRAQGLEEGDEHPLCSLVEHGWLYLSLPMHTLDRRLNQNSNAGPSTCPSKLLLAFGYKGVIDLAIWAICFTIYRYSSFLLFFPVNKLFLCPLLCHCNALPNQARMICYNFSLTHFFWTVIKQRSIQSCIIIFRHYHNTSQFRKITTIVIYPQRV